MEEKQEKKQPEFKGKVGIIWLTAVLVILLGCVTVYTFKLVNENKKLKQIPQAQQPQLTEQKQTTEKTSKVESTTSEEKTEKRIELTNKEKIDFNNKFSQLTTKGAVAFPNTTNLIETDEGKYKFICLIKYDDLHDDKESILVEKNDRPDDRFLPVQKFQKYVKDFYGTALNISNLKNYIYNKNGISYINISIEGLVAEYAVKTDYIVENTQTNERSLYINLIDINQINIDKVDQYLSKDFLDYDRSKISQILKVTCKIDSSNNDEYVITDVRYVKK